MERTMFTEEQQKEVLARAQVRDKQTREEMIRRLHEFDSIAEYPKQRIEFVKQQPTPATRLQFRIDDYGFLYVNLLPDGRKLWVARWPGCKGSGKRYQCVLGDFDTLTYNQESWLEDAAMNPNPIAA